jgi:hypothetical protein
MSGDDTRDTGGPAESLSERLRREERERRIAAFLSDPTSELEAIDFANAYIFERGPKTEADLEKLTGAVDKLREQVESLRRERVPLPWLYLLVLLLVVAATGSLVFYGWAEKPEVSIDYNVGEIIGGLLVGVGALVASTAYAVRGRG